MSLPGFFLDRLAPLLALRRKHQPRRTAPDPRILVIRRNRLGDMIYTLPLLHALRRHHPQAHITVACDPLGEPIALACPAVNDVILLDPGWNPIQAAFRNAAHLQDYDWVIAAKGGFDGRLAMLTRLTNAAVRIGFTPEHQIETLLRLLAPLGLAKPTGFSVNLSLKLPDSAVQFARETRLKPPFSEARRFVLINISSTVPLKFGEEDFIALSKRLLNLTDLAIGFVASPKDQQKAREIVMCMASKRIVAVETPGPLELAALMDDAAFVLTPEGGAAHLAAARKRPALVLWSEGPFEKWHSRHERHVFVQNQPNEPAIPLERVWEALQPFLVLKKSSVDQSWDDALQSSEYDPLEN
jgi:ADP-heptose:LPS heptosyltransferase